MNRQHLTCVDDFEDEAKRKLSYGALDYYSKGVKKLELTLKDSRKAFSRYRLRPRIFQYRLPRNLSTTVLGEKIKIPIGVSPTALHALAHITKEKGTAEAAQAHGTVMILSSVANTDIKELRQKASTGLLWMQTYFFKTPAVTESIIRNAERAGFKAIVVTIDSSGLQIRHNKASGTLRSCDYEATRTDLSVVNIENSSTQASLYTSVEEINNSHATAEDILWLKSFTKLPVVVKGVLNASTAKRAASLGVDGILVSAHGGRQLDGAPAPIDALPEVVEAVRGSGVEVYMDGGIRTGTDVLKALALGARAVFIGRPVLWGLAVDGSKGVKEVLQILKEELDLAMTLSGVGDVQRVPRSVVVHESEYLASKL